ncbi:putative elongation factor 1B gamma, glutathione S-transferase, Thioredoxin-like superfamily [Helianthus annuus]|nr:putative elongation factor 1B gamma, glutathione S-transferase, Thioredoxin-like superfamily [Helianthus annuus]
MTLIIHSVKQSKNVYKALIAAEYVGVEIKVVDDFEMGVSNKTPEFLKMNPIGKVPVLETPDGPIFESNAIARYVARGSFLFGSSPIEYGQIEQWIDFSAFEFDLNIRGWYIPRLGYGNYIKPAEENCISGLKRGLDALNKYLASHTFLVGDGITLADIITTCNMFMAFKLLTPKSFTSRVGEFKQTEAVIPLSSAKKTEAKPKPEPKKEVKEKEALKPEVKAAEEEEAPKPKPKNLLDLLPPSKMVLDDWKRLYSNTESNIREVAIKGFWDMFDPEGYSLWFCDYKYNDENTVSFVTMNKVGGFLQCMDLARKYAFTHHIL